MENLSEEEIISYVDEMKNYIFKSHDEKEGVVEGEIKTEIYSLITDGFDEGSKISNIEFEKMMKDVILKLSKLLQKDIEGLPEFLANRFSFDVVSQTILAQYIPDEDKYDPMFG